MAWEGQGERDRVERGGLSWRRSRAGVQQAGSSALHTDARLTGMDPFPELFGP